MTADLICLSDFALLGKANEKTVSFASKQLFFQGHKINNILTLGSRVEQLKIHIEQSSSNLFVIFVANNQTAKNEVNKYIADKFDCSLVENKKVKTQIASFYQIKNIPMPKDIEFDWFFPSKATIITNPTGNTQGYTISSQGQMFFVLPYEFYDAKNIILNGMMPLLKSKQSTNYITQTYKAFGISDSDTRKVLADVIKNKEKISINTFANNMNVDIVLKSLDSNPYMEKYSQIVFDRLGKFIFAEEDMDACETCFELLKLNRLTISFAESVTGGNISAQLIKKNEGASEFVKEGLVVYSNQAKKELLGVGDITLKNFSSVSVETTYEMATGLLNRAKTDLVVATTGYASSDNDTGSSGIAYIAIGDKNAIHVYKNFFHGSRDEIIDSITDATYFYLIKKLRKNDFHFDKTTV